MSFQIVTSNGLGAHDTPIIVDDYDTQWTPDYAGESTYPQSAPAAKHQYQFQSLSPRPDSLSHFVPPSPSTPSAYGEHKDTTHLVADSDDSSVPAPPPSYQTPSARSGASFRWSIPTSLSSVTYVCNKDGRQLYAVKAPRKRKVTISDAEYGHIVAKLKWPKWPSKPNLSLNRDIPMRLKDWIIYDRELQCRYVLLRGDRYYIGESTNGGISICKNSFDDEVASIRSSTNAIDLNLSSGTIVLLEEFVILATILHLSPLMEKKK